MGLGKLFKMIMVFLCKEIFIIVVFFIYKSVEMIVEFVEGWLLIMFILGKVNDYWGDVFKVGVVEWLSDLLLFEIYVGGMVVIGDGLEGLCDFGWLMMVFYVGGMGV